MDPDVNDMEGDVHQEPGTISEDMIRLLTDTFRDCVDQAWNYPAEHGKEGAD